MQYSFKQFFLDTDNQQLKIAQQVVDADERQVKLLELLIENYPETCSQELLQQHLWPVTVVSDWSLPKLISETRKLFSQSGLAEDIIETRHGKGYRLSAHIGCQLLNGGHQKVAAREINLSQRLLVSVFVIIMVMGSTALWLRKSENEVPPLRFGEPENSIGRVLWVDDNPANNVKEVEYLYANGIGVYQVTTTEEALRITGIYNYQAVISDMGRHKDPLAGLKLLDAIRARGDNTPFLLYTLVAPKELIEEVKQHKGQGVTIDEQGLYQALLPFFDVND